MTTTPRPNPGHSGARRTPAYFGKPLGRLHITFNIPQWNKRRTARRFAERRWDMRDPKLTGELLLAGLKENA